MRRISIDSCYTLEELMKRTGLKRDAMRTARRKGLRVIYRHNRGYVLGRDWLSYLDMQAKADSAEVVNGHE
ncbi:hypothetical protein F1728_31020 [Gimesia benthica]|uniref:DNA-binding protein n=1 Tax=Gimesia benthica TaxID=2608982 RepID=A0A6I6AKZ1_9PLAN|nr:hypothetical protein [Gimesia benthica]QGQ26836.1 hypothetical protein F1728_31020 [Gimesia benthica]